MGAKINKVLSEIFYLYSAGIIPVYNIYSDRAVGEPPLHELPLNLSLSDAGVRDSTSRMSVVEYKFKPKSLILPASLITVGAIGTAIDGMNDFHLFSRKDSVKKIRIDDYMEWGMLGWVFVCDLMGKEKHNWVDQLCLVAIAEGSTLP